MKIECRPLGAIAANCYMISGESAAVVVDPGAYSLKVKDFLDENKDKARMIILTHGHFDHIGGALRLREETGTQITVGENDAKALSDPKLNLSELFGISMQPFEADKTVSGGDVLTVGDLEFKVIHTPGHTVGGICLLLGDVLISGDILFEGSVGRTDFPGGNTNELIDSLAKLMTLDGETRVLSGHGRETTIKKERIHNPCLRGII